MDENHRKILLQNWAEFRKDLEPIKLLPSLVGVLDQADMEGIGAEGKREDRCDMFLGALQRSGPKAFDAFVEALEKTSQAHLASNLTKQSGKNLFFWLIFFCYSCKELRASA